jgi:lincosamide nucleotidyltransferase A/C/D/E
MTEEDVLDFLNLADQLGVRIWLDGGWAVDACLGEQTRPHADLDIVIEERHLPAVRSALEHRGFSPVPRDDTRAWNFVLGDEAGREIDFHVIKLNERGNGQYGLQGEVYPSEALSGRGTGYELDADDWADIHALCARFHIPLPQGEGRGGG